MSLTCQALIEVLGFSTDQEVKILPLMVFIVLPINLSIFSYILISCEKLGQLL